MANIKNMEMAQMLLSNQNIEEKKGLFGLSTKLVYKPTDSTIKGFNFEFDADNGQRMRSFLACPDDGVEEALKKNADIKVAPIGCYRLNACISDDHQFVALQLFSFSDFKYHSLGDAKIYEGKNAESLAKILK